MGQKKLGSEGCLLATAGTQLSKWVTFFFLDEEALSTLQEDMRYKIATIFVLRIVYSLLRTSCLSRTPSETSILSIQFRHLPSRSDTSCTLMCLSACVQFLPVTICHPL